MKVVFLVCPNSRPSQQTTTRHRERFEQRVEREHGWEPQQQQQSVELERVPAVGCPDYEWMVLWAGNP